MKPNIGKKTKSIKIEVNRLRSYLLEILISAGMNQQDAFITSEVLIEAELRGFSLHGVERILQILQGISKKTLNVHAKPRYLKKNSAVSVIDGAFCVGHPIAHKAMHLAVKKAHKNGVGIVGVINSGHIGMLSYYSEIASTNQCVGLVMSTTLPSVVIAGGSTKTFGSNPISYSFPSSSLPITADFSTSKMSISKFMALLRQDQNIPPGTAVDKNGQNTLNPSEALHGGIHTLDGNIKGSMISMLVSVMAGNLIGGVINPNVKGNKTMDDSPTKGDFLECMTAPFCIN